MKETFWTKEKLRILRKYFRTTSTSACAAMLRYGTEAVKKKASRLGLKKSARYRRQVLHRG